MIGATTYRHSRRQEAFLGPAARDVRSARQPSLARALKAAASGNPPIRSTAPSSSKEKPRSASPRQPPIGSATSSSTSAGAEEQPRSVPPRRPLSGSTISSSTSVDSEAEKLPIPLTANGRYIGALLREASQDVAELLRPLTSPRGSSAPRSQGAQGPECAPRSTSTTPRGGSRAETPDFGRPVEHVEEIGGATGLQRRKPSPRTARSQPPVPNAGAAVSSCSNPHSPPLAEWKRTRSPLSEASTATSLGGDCVDSDDSSLASKVRHGSKLVPQRSATPAAKRCIATERRQNIESSRCLGGRESGAFCGSEDGKRGGPVQASTPRSCRGPYRAPSAASAAMGGNAKQQRDHTQQQQQSQQQQRRSLPAQSVARRSASACALRRATWQY